MNKDVWLFWLCMFKNSKIVSKCKWKVLVGKIINNLGWILMQRVQMATIFKSIVKTQRFRNVDGNRITHGFIIKWRVKLARTMVFVFVLGLFFFLVMLLVFLVLVRNVHIRQIARRMSSFPVLGRRVTTTAVGWIAGMMSFLFILLLVFGRPHCSRAAFSNENGLKIYSRQRMNNNNNKNNTYGYGRSWIARSPLDRTSYNLKSVDRGLW